MIPIEHIQFAATTLTGALTLILVFMMPIRETMGQAYNRSRWMMVAGTALLPVQFLLQYTMHFRRMGVEPAVSVLYTIMQFYYTAQLWREFRRVRLALENYFDRERHGIIRWMRNSTMLLSLSAVFAPMVIFWSGPLLFVYTLVILFGIFYTVISFYSYGMDRRHMQALQEVERSMEEDEQKKKAEGDGRNDSQMSDDDKQRISAAVRAWLEKGGHLHSGITLHTAADEIGVPRYQLSAWLKTTPQGLFNPWLTSLRIEEAKRQLKEHNWSNDTIAEHCGFSSRSYFQTTFKKLTGQTPAQYIEANKD